MASEIEESGGEEKRSGRRFTLMDLIVVIGVIALALVIIIPAIQQQRERGRRSACLHNAHQIGLALQNYASTYNNVFPPSATLYGTGVTKTVGGYSFLAKLQPFMEYSSKYSRLLDAAPGRDGALPENNPTFIELANELVPEYICPSNTNSKIQNPTGSPPHFAFTNYKALGATTKNSLLVCTGQVTAAPYATISVHPDGMIYPAQSNLSLAALTDDTSHTIAIMETIDDRNSRWVVGNECTLVGLPQASGNATKVPPNTFYAPPGFDGTFGDGSAVSRAGLRTFLMYDFSPGGADAGMYEDPGWAKGPPAFGPSSMHPNVAIVTFCDGSVTALNKRCDAANLFFLITKNNGNPAR